MDLSAAFESEFCDFVGDACRGFYRLLRATFRSSSLFPAELCSRPFYNCGFRSAARAAVFHPKNAVALWRDERVSPLRNVERIVAVRDVAIAVSWRTLPIYSPQAAGNRARRSAEHRAKLAPAFAPTSRHGGDSSGAAAR